MPQSEGSSDGKAVTEKIEHLYLALRSIREVDQLLIKMKDRSKLIQAICDTLIKNRSYYNAWIVLMDESGRVVETAESGLGGDFQPMLDRLRQGVFTDCGRRALAQSQVVVIKDPYVACKDCPLSEKYSGRSAMSVRLESEGRVFGLLCVSIPRQFTENEEELQLLQEMAGDITYGISKIALEAALEENQQSFQDLVENSPTGLLIVQDGVVIYRNPEYERISGTRHQEHSKLGFTNVHPEDLEKVQLLYNKVISGQARTVDTDFRFYPAGRINSKASMKWVYCRASSIDYKGKEAVLINMIDITPAKELEQLVVAKDKMTSLGHIAAGIAHEIRNPLSGINIYLNTLENMFGESDRPEMMSQILGQIQSASRKIESIIKRVIDFSKPSEPRLVPADVNRPIQEAIELSSVAMRKSGVKISSSLGADLPQCYIDPNLIEEVVLNLITNAAEAMKHNDGDKLIEIASGAQEDHISVRISDSGPGVPVELRTKVFEPFYTTKKSGTGIGLSLCHRIITDHGGSLMIETSKWSGAEFIIKLPTERRG
jgi:PAS domain S-box-containing protein